MNKAVHSHILTHLFTDLVDSTRLWEQHPDAMRPAMAAHDELLKEAVHAHGGTLVKTTGDGLHAVFESPAGAVSAAVACQQAILAGAWPEETGPLKVRMGAHTGDAQPRDGDYYGPEVNRAARVMSAAHGGQIVVSEVTAALVRKEMPGDASLQELGEHRLKSLAAPEALFQVCHPGLPVEFPHLNSLEAYKHNLPIRLSRFVGREKELAEVKNLLGETRLLTLLGPGGTGKTRLSLQAAADVIDRFRDGVWFVELAALQDPELLPEQLADALGVQEHPGRSMLGSITDYLRGKHILVLLDNVEHLVRESAALVEHLLRHCPDVHFIVTGREALFIGAEITMQIPSMRLPTEAESEDLAHFSGCEAVQLFIERVRAAQPNFELSAAVAPAVGEIVRRLDGIPLALELAAARTRMMSVPQVADRLNDRFRLLTGGRRTALPRQQTLQALIDWSWNLLEEEEQIVLRRLSVFSGGWTLEAAETVAGFDGVDVFFALEGLVNKSLVEIDRSDSKAVRYRFLESIRQYARDRLFDAGEGEGLRGRHADYYLGLALAAVPHMYEADMMDWIHPLRAEIDNLRALMAWSLDSRPETALKLAGMLHYQQAFWMRPDEAREWSEAAVRAARPLYEAGDAEIAYTDFIEGLLSMAVTAGMQGEVAVAQAAVGEAVELARAQGHDRLLARALPISAMPTIFTRKQELVPEVEEAIRISRENGYRVELFFGLIILGGIYLISGDLEKGERYVEEGLAMVRANGNPRALARTLDIRAAFFWIRREFSPAIDLFTQAAEKFAEIGDRIRVNMSRSQAAHCYRGAGDLDQAESWYRRTIQKYLDYGHIPAVAHQLECFAYIAIAREKYQRATRLLGAAGEIRRRVNSPSTDPVEIAELEGGLAAVQEAIGEQARDRLMEEGARLEMDQAVELALGEVHSPK